MVKLGSGRPAIFEAVASTYAESTPPLRYPTTGTSAAEPDLDGALERRLEFIDQRRWVGGILLMAPIGEVEIPIAPLLDLRGGRRLAETRS